MNSCCLSDEYHSCVFVLSLCRLDNGKAVYFSKEEDLKYHMSKAHPAMKLSSINSEECVKYITIQAKEDIHKLESNKYTGEKPSPGGDEERPRKRKVSQDTAAEKTLPKKLKFSLPTNFTCAKSQCLFQTSDRAEFKTHIETHRHDHSLPQCEECGMCFRIEASLKRHLFIQHGIREYDSYIRLLRGGGPSPTPAENSTSPCPTEEKTPQASPSLSSALVSDKVAPLECQVCYKTFQNEGTLRTHMRNHGMAFIRSKRSISND